ncbi:MAG: tetratricopeptide repeat protein [Phycisphaerae bacterium]|nr:tetratricopeptide repeat protein [Saprospiraceae bacterium]
MQSPVFISNVKHAPLAASLVIGRTDELQKIADALDKGDDLLLLNGMGGVGKTTLAGFYMERYAARYQHIAWISCSGDFRGDLVRQLNRQRIPGLPDTDNVPELFAAMLLSMEDMPGPNLLIADNLNTPAQIEDLAQHKPQFPRNWKMLITARCNTGAFPERAIGVLEDEEAKELFSRHYALRTGDTEAQLQDLLHKVGRHTLAVEFIAKTLAQLPAWNLARMLRHLSEKGLADLSTAATVITAHSRDMRVLMEEYLHAIFEINLGAIGEKPRELLAQLAMFPAQPHPFPILCQVLGCTAEAEMDLLAATLNLLKNNGLLEDLAADGWYLHPLLQEVARQKWPPSYETVASILDRLEEALDNWPLPESLPLLPYAVAIVERLQFEDAQLASVCWTISDRYYDIGDFPNSERFMQASNRLYVSVDDKRNMGVTFERLGRLAKDQGDMEKALEFFEQYKNINEEACSANPESEDLKNLLTISYEKMGDIFQAQGKMDEALNFFEKKLKLTEELYAANPRSESLKSGMAISYEKLGSTYKARGEMDEALSFFEKYKQFTEELCAANPHSESLKHYLAASYERLGSIFQAQGKMDEALSFFEKRSKLGEELYVANPHSESLKSGLAISYSKLGSIFQAQGKMDKALSFFEKYKQFNEELYTANPRSERLGIGLGVSYTKLAEWHKAQKNPAQALEYYRKGLALYEQWHAVTGRLDVGGWIEVIRGRIAELE